MNGLLCDVPLSAFRFSCVGVKKGSAHAVFRNGLCSQKKHTPCYPRSASDSNDPCSQGKYFYFADLGVS